MAEGINKLSGLGALMKNRASVTTAKQETETTVNTATGGSPKNAAPTDSGSQAGDIGAAGQSVPKVNPLAGKLGGLGGLSKLKPATQTFGETRAAIVAGKELDAGFDLNALASSEDMGEIPEDLEHESNAFKAAFSDETPAGKPMREIPADCDSQMKLFIELMDNMYDTELRQDLELLSGMIRSIMVELKANPQYIQQVRKEDIRTWVQAMRQTMGLAKIKKAEKQEKRKTGTTASKAKSKKSDEMFDDVFAELGIVAD